jgi:hypothetical protein
MADAERLQAVADLEFTFRTKPGPGFDGVVRCRILEREPPSRMEWSWCGVPIDTVVRFDLEQGEVMAHAKLRELDGVDPPLFAD